MAIFDNESKQSKINHLTPTGYISLYPLTLSNSVVIDNTNEIFLDTKISEIDNHLYDSDIHFTMDDVTSYLNKPVSIHTDSTTSTSVSALCTVNNRIFIGSTNKVESFLSTGTRGRETTVNMEGTTLVPAISECGNGNILTAKGNALIETSYYLTGPYKRLMFSDTSQYITAVATYDLGASVVVAIGTSTGRVGLFKYKPGSNDFISSYVFTSTISSSIGVFDITNKLFIYSNNNPITDILLTYDRLIIGNSNSAGTAGTSTTYSYSISSTGSITVSLIGSSSSVAGREVGIDFVDNETSLIIGFTNGSCMKTIINNPSATGMSYNQQRPGTDLIDMVTDNDENIYLLYSDGLLRKVNSADVKLWDYQTEIGGTALMMSIDKDNYYIVVCNTTGQFEIISYMTGKNLTKSTESALMMLKAQVLPGDYIEKIEVCQLSGNVSLTGDITGSVELNADNTCLIDPDNADHTIHKIEISTNISDNVVLPTSTTIITDNNINDNSVVNKKYVDTIVDNNIPTVMSSAQPQDDDLPTGGIWFEIV